MKALFTTFPAYGHLLPMLPLAQAAAAAGDEVVIAAPKDLHQAVDGLTTRVLGPSLPDILAENDRRSGEDVLGYRSDSSRLLDATVAMFTTTRADMAFDELCAIATDERPDVIVAEMWDYVAPLVARRLGIPWVTFVHSPATAIDAVLEGGMVKALEQRELTTPAPLATVQLWPDWLESERNAAPEEAELAIGATPYTTSAVVDIPAFDGERPVVLVTFGTVVDDVALLNSAVRGVLDAGADALVTTGFAAGPEAIEGIEADSDRVRAVPFAPIGQLLDRVQAVVAAGGSGTTLAALSRGLPLAFVPRIANQPQVASVVAGFGAGVVCDDPAKLTTTVEQLLAEPGLRAQARAASDLLARRPAPDAVWSALRDRIGVSGR
ncbi:UDP:flavonoid glycosyltransferase YjiC (YdhE family) [Streptomyces sp. LBL]|uniref:glycosyltransferase n=1 Tax=Streptomyces sp. LBL TaxID=2940562 RepID=UPI002474B592|nr:glycosyltransferase [Streptomyces sp. LBL]MDH6627566.1 UDP:flavonoid glycosyltransferase YjiC (YdhE family) [Streptomyces sp. LBL]